MEGVTGKCGTWFRPQFAAENGSESLLSFTV